MSEKDPRFTTDGMLKEGSIRGAMKGGVMNSEAKPSFKPSAPPPAPTPPAPQSPKKDNT